MNTAEGGTAAVIQPGSAAESSDTPSAASSSTEAVSSSEALWALLQAPFHPVEATRALFGLSPASARYLVGRELLISDEAGHLLDSMPEIIRYMKNQLNFAEVRTVGSVIGPIQWHSTITARASAGNADDLFVCAAPYRDFNLAENQLLVHTLGQLVRSGGYVKAFTRDSFDDDRTTLARERAREAASYLDIRSLSSVKGKNDPQTVRRTHRSTDRAIYQPLLDFLPRTDRPLSQFAITHLSDRRTSLQHKILLAVLATLRRGGIDVLPVRPSDGVLSAGPVEFRHPGARGGAGAHGIRIGHVLIDVPDVASDRDGSIRRQGQRSGMLTPYVVESVAEVTELRDKLVQAAEQRIAGAAGATG